MQAVGFGENAGHHVAANEQVPGRHRHQNRAVTEEPLKPSVGSVLAKRVKFLFRHSGKACPGIDCFLRKLGSAAYHIKIPRHRHQHQQKGLMSSCTFIGCKGRR